MKRLSCLLGALALSVGLGVSAFALVTPNKTDHIDYCTGANNSNCVFQIDANGNVTGNSFTSQGSQSVTPGSQTLAQINALVPIKVGQIIYCSNCQGTPLCVSSSTVVGSFTTVSSTSTHCN